MEEDKDVPHTMGHPFLAIGQSLIDVAAGELILRVDDEKVVFTIFKALKYPKLTYDYFMVNVICGDIGEIQEKHHSSNPLEHALVSDDTTQR